MFKPAEARLSSSVFIVAAGLMYCHAAMASMTVTTDIDQKIVEHRVSEDKLENIRGGMRYGDFDVAFGIDRAVYVDGQLQYQTSYQWYSKNPKNISYDTKHDANPIASTPSGSPGKTVVIAANDGNGVPQSLVVQNSANNTVIKSVTTLDTTINGMEAFRSGRISNAITNSIMRNIR
ncbi:hypothetical protein [Crenobacter luteus]|uniref:hypothetical protein n=1 Tax=Crenobacter luteus TaxID=1452487 RepID=UPI000A3F7096|nr:hypothetical protein [Crenobacter luteus]